MTGYNLPCKICDPLHGFIRFDPTERRVIDSLPFQRLRYIHQLGVAYLLYPGATHSRFEHSLGVMELSTRIFDTILAPHNLVAKGNILISEEERVYWRRILRMAALCHDLGHLPFSHTAEKTLLPEGGHEGKSVECIQSAYLRPIWGEMGKGAEEDLLQVVTGKTSRPWVRALYKVITDDNVGADRIDYLLRDGYYTGVGYGHFDYHQLIDTLRLLPEGIGVAKSGVQAVESLLIARYLMYARVYHHPKLRVYTQHMKRFMESHCPISQSIEEYLLQTDYILLTRLLEVARRGDFDAGCLLKYHPPFSEVPLENIPEELILARSQQLLEAFDGELFIDRLSFKEADRAFSVVNEEGAILPSFEVSPFLAQIPLGGKPLRLYAHPRVTERVKQRILEEEI